MERSKVKYQQSCPILIVSVHPILLIYICII